MLIRLLRNRWGLIALLLAGGWQLGSGGWIWAKAWLAQQLLDHSWTSMRYDPNAQPIKPWPWADTHARGRLQIPSLQVDQIVLDGDSGRTLAFGPGLSHAGRDIGEPGVTLISGHRDTHFDFMPQLRESMVIRLQSRTGERRYRVSERRVVDSRDGGISLDPDQDGLLLVTCYPFENWQPGGPLRFLVWAEPVDSDQVSGEADGSMLPVIGRVKEAVRRVI
ncbi:class GN sortase [Motiliproteus coralliicola]|uniref:Class GN sortase n=1 Tax=Motiliproteus coralliicola TaxID=2283196 RepID=A0A369WC98_9GAMM|nr:class GN sortase [Motiliproteus coralliicola]RDE18246.1 class GN sortase [Motiliproteus coralliicola]